MRLGRRHRARDSTDYLELADGRTAMKNTDAVFVRRRMGAKDAKPVDGCFGQISVWFSTGSIFGRILARWRWKIAGKKFGNCRKHAKTDGTALVGPVDWFLSSPGRRTPRCLADGVPNDNHLLFSNPLVTKMFLRALMLCFLRCRRRHCHTWMVWKAEKYEL